MPARDEEPQHLVRASHLELLWQAAIKCDVGSEQTLPSEPQAERSGDARCAPATVSGRNLNRLGGAPRDLYLLLAKLETYCKSINHEKVVKVGFWIGNQEFYDY